MGVGNGDRTFRQLDRDRRKTKHGMTVGRGRGVEYPHDGDRDSLRGEEPGVQQSKRDHQLREILKRKVDFKVHMGTFFFFTSWKVCRMGAGSVCLIDRVFRCQGRLRILTSVLSYEKRE